MKLLFIHIPRTGGRSITENEVKVKNAGHVFAKDIKDIKDYFSFTIVRNPYDRFMSSYYFHLVGYKGKREISQEIHKYKNFRHFVENFHTFKYKDDIQFTPQYKFTENANITSICKFEDIEFEWEWICLILKIPDKKLPHINNSKHFPWQIEYNNEMRKTVYKLYEKDFDLFNY